MKNKPLKTYSLDEITDKYIGKRGTPKRELFENELKKVNFNVVLLNQNVKLA